MRTPPPELPDHAPELPAQPAALPPRTGPPRPGSPWPGSPWPGSPFRELPFRGRPLPDVAAVHRIPLPESAPPYDDQAAGEPSPGRSPRARPAASAGQAAGSGGQGQWPRQFAQALAEALAGSRSSQQMTPWTTQQARRRIRELGPLLQAGQRPRVRRILTSAPAVGVVEMTVIVGIGPQVRAMAVRLERTGPQRGRPAGGGAWLCTAVEAA